MTTVTRPALRYHGAKFRLGGPLPVIADDDEFCSITGAFLPPPNARSAA